MAAEVKIDDKLAISYFLKDKKKFFKSVLVFYGIFICFIVLACIPIIGIIPCILFGLIFSGYWMNNAHIRVFKPTNEPPELRNFKKIIDIGFKFLAADFLLKIPVILVILLPFFAMAGDSGKTQNEILIPFIIIYIVVITLYCLYVSVAMLAFIGDLKFKSFFNLKAIKYIIKSNCIKGYILRMILYYLLFSVAIGILAATLVGLIFFPLVMFILIAVMSDIQAQYVRAIFKIGTREQMGA